jgi:hypothetical protein
VFLLSTPLRIGVFGPPHIEGHPKLPPRVLGDPPSPLIPRGSCRPHHRSIISQVISCVTGFPCNDAQLLCVFAAIGGGVVLAVSVVMNDSEEQTKRDQSKTYVQIGLVLLGLAVTFFFVGGGTSTT